MSATVDRTALRRTIREYIEANDAPTWSEIVNAVPADTNAKPTTVGRELDELEAHGFIYCVPTDDGEEVRLV